MARVTSTTRRPGRPRNNADQPDRDRRAQLCTAALDLFAESGLARVSVKQIAERAGVDAALIYYYFAGKDDLFPAAVAHAVETGYAVFKRLAGEGGAPVTTLAAWLDVQET
ncbi:MAG: helix-turn-helix domain-containing protein, partial [Anaerolineales bacterium]